MPHGAIRFPFGDCRVCTDKATGVHYGVATCEGCKGFFKRSLPKYERYRCFNDGKCTFDRNDRNRCKACRFQRCLSVGMSLEGVKMGRIPKVDKERALEEEQRRLLAEGTSSSQGTVSMDSQQYPVNTCCWSPATTLPTPSSAIYTSAPLSSPLSIRGGTSSAVRMTSPREPRRSASSSRDDRYFQVEHSPMCDRHTGSRHGEYASYRRSWSDNQSYNQPAPPLPPPPPPQSYSDDWRHQREEFETRPPIDRSYRFNVQDGAESSSRSEMYGVVAKTSLSSSYYGAVGERGSSGIGSDYLPPATNPGHRDQSSPCPSSHSSGSISPYSPQVIKELINQVIQSGHTRELGLNFAHKLLTSTPGGIPVTNVSSQSASLYAQPPPDERMYCGQKLSSLDAMSDDQPQNLCVNESANLAADMSSKFKWPTASADDSTSGIDCGENGCCREPLDMSVTGPRTRPETPSDIESSIGTNSSPSLRVDDTRPGAENADSCSPGGVERMEIDPVEVGVTNELSGDEKPFPFDFGLIVPLPDLTRVPELKFWDVGLPDLGSEEDVFRSPMPPDTAARREETESVLAWLTEATEVFTTCINMCRMYSEEEEKGIRPIHRLNRPENASSPESARLVWNEVIQSFPTNNSYVLGLCSAIPGFGELCQQDKAVLMETAYFEIWLIQWSPLFGSEDTYFRMASGVRYSKHWMQTFLPESLVQSMFQFAKDLNSCQLTQTELIILSAIQLTNAGCKGLSDVSKVQQLHDYYLDLLAYEIERNHAATHSRILIKIFQLLPMLGPINAESAVLMNYNVDAPPDSDPESNRDSNEDSLSE